jgi:ketosteroid isomerase-like protein
MSRENVETVRRLYALFVRRDLDRALSEHADPDFELRIPALYPEGGEVLRGRDALERWLARIDELWTVWHFEPQRYIDAEAGVIALVRIVAESDSSGVRMERDVGHVWSLSDGRATGVTVYLTREEALEAAGLEE